MRFPRPGLECQGVPLDHGLGKGAAKGLAQKDSLFNEALEKKWVLDWVSFKLKARQSSTSSKGP